MTRLSVVAPLWQDRPGAENLEVAQVADSLGFSEMWIGEMATYDAFSLATAIGLSTRLTPTVGPLAVGVRTPTGMAMGAASVSDLIGRPVRLALGSSSPLVVQQWHGRRWSSDPARLIAAAGIARTLLDGGRTDHDGPLPSHGYRLRLDAPGAHITLAAFGPRSVAAAASHADRVALNMVTVEAAGRLAADVARLAAEAGRSKPTVATWLVTAIDPEPEARAQMAAARVGYLAAPGYDSILTEAGFGDLVAYARTRPHPRELAAAIPAELDAAVGLVGSASEVEARIAAYHEVGVDEVAVVPVTAGDPAGARTLAELARL